ncbi:universal stress protein [Halocatena pleomorpha]|uniref:Universal stress protein n=1 Tax=Halocatena pleomorpha TaxID=1785090 RepID=A0A3P3RD38_9EURY|nr:universal stress protein [Halocatena pleomorpha]RRJ31417.1 universal stress protein [Halocatena pleomorpha]
MYENILLPFDGSDGAASILHHTSEIAHRTDATVHILYVADTSRDSATVVNGRVVDGLVQQGEKIVDEAAKTLHTLGVTHDTDVVQGNPAPTIVEYAERYGHDLIVLPTHAREGISRYLIGSISEKVVRLSSVPVLTARMQPDEQLKFPYKKILLPTDGSTAATRAAAHGLLLAASLDAVVHVLSVVDETEVGLSVRSVGTEQDSEQVALNAVTDIISEAEEYGIGDTVQHIERGTPVEAIRDCIESNDIHAVVMGTTGKHGTDRILLGSVAEKTVRSAPVPVITLAESE